MKNTILEIRVNAAELRDEIRNLKIDTELLEIQKRLNELREVIKKLLLANISVK